MEIIKYTLRVKRRRDLANYKKLVRMAKNEGISINTLMLELIQDKVK